MNQLLYSALDIAAIVYNMQLGCKEELKLLDLIWCRERKYLYSNHCENKRLFIHDVLYWLQYFNEKDIIDSEFPAIQKDFASLGNLLDKELYTNDFSNLDLFFKNVRIRILYLDDQNYVRVKMRTLLKRYGYKRRSQLLLQHIKQCVSFYNLEATTRGGKPCLFDQIDLDTMIVFRVEN